MTHIWDAKTYIQFLDLRTRPARDLLAAIPNTFQPNIIYDLGSGPGNSTILLKNRWPNANITGVDSSSDMLDAAKKAYPNLHFVQEDITHFSPQVKADFLFANASLQWLNQHEILISRLLALLQDGGAFGIQMPNNFHAPTHQIIIHILQNNPDWQPFLNHLRYGTLIEPFYTASWYYHLFTTLKISALDIWETEYFQEMPHYEAIFDWIKGTALRPVFSILPPKDQKQFADLYIKALAKAYPLQHNNKILLPFRRIFIIGFKTHSAAL